MDRVSLAWATPPSLKPLCGAVSCATRTAADFEQAVLQRQSLAAYVNNSKEEQ